MFPRKRVAVIGAGAAGLCAARKCLARGMHVVIFEATQNVGGTWFYTPEINVHSSMYEDLRTNLPKEIMGFSDLEFPSHLPSFMLSSDVLAYLQKYSESVQHCVQFQTTVVAIERFESKWRITTSPAAREQSDDFDAVFVCNGHFTVPSLPRLPGIFSGRVLHSHNYRTPLPYANEVVAVIGVGPSGTDIALQVACVAEKVYLLHDKDALRSPLPPNVIQGKKPVSCNGSLLVLEDNSSIRVDTVIYCTGYSYSLPFAGDLVQLKYDAKMVSPTYLHIAHTLYPRSLFFIGLNFAVLPFTLFEHQVLFALALLEGTAKISDNDVRLWERKRMSELLLCGIDGNMFHHLGDSQWNYFAELRRIAGLPSLIRPVVRNIYNDVASRRHRNLMNYKNTKYTITANDSFVVTEQEEIP